MAAGPAFPHVKTNRGPAPAGKGPTVTPGSVGGMANSPMATPAMTGKMFPSAKMKPKSS